MVKCVNNILGDIMEKIIKRILIICITIFYLLFLYGCTNQNDNELRLRIFANSNSELDQQLKKEVKSFLEENLQDELILKDCKAIEDKLNNHFLNAKIVVKQGKVKYEAKSYKGKIIPSGYYDTILITIGEGKGKNFWTILYPEFFNISFEDDKEIEYHSYFYDLFNKE